MLVKNQVFIHFLQIKYFDDGLIFFNMLKFFRMTANILSFHSLSLGVTFENFIRGLVIKDITINVHSVKFAALQCVPYETADHFISFDKIQIVAEVLNRLW